jgi:polysaccharide biosynthesis transport protein
LIVIDSPPILGFPEPLQMAAAVDGVVIVAWPAKPTATRGFRAHTLQRVRANVVGWC